MSSKAGQIFNLYLNYSERINYNSQQKRATNYFFYLESKFVFCLLSIFTLGIYPCYNRYKRDQIKLKYNLQYQEAVREMKAHKALCANVIKDNRSFISTLIRSLTKNGSHLHRNKGLKDLLFITCYYAINIFLFFATCFVYMFYLMYQKLREGWKNDNVNVFLNQIRTKRLNEIKAQRALSEAKEIARIERLNKSLKKPDEFNYEFALTESIKSSVFESSSNRKGTTIDPFILVLYYLTYLLFGLFTLGGFFIYIAYQKHIKKVDYSFFHQFLSKEQRDIEDFNRRISDLTNEGIYVDDYAALLTQQSLKHTTTPYDYNSSFKSIFFKSQVYKYITILCLSILTCGIFPIYIFYKLIDNGDAKTFECISQPIYKPIDKDASDKNKNMLKLALKRFIDIKFDISLAIVLAKLKLTSNTPKLDIHPSFSDLGCLFINVVKSAIFKWLFAMVLLLINYTLIWMWGSYYAFSFDNLIFVALFLFTSFFFVAISYHIYLLF